MPRKVSVDLKVGMILYVDDDLELSQVIENISFNSNGRGFSILDAGIDDYEIIDSKQV